MNTFFQGVRKHIGKLDAEHLREQYALVSEALAQSDRLVNALTEGIVRLDAAGKVLQQNPAAKNLLGMEPADILPDLDLPLSKVSKREIAVTYPEARSLEIRTLPLGEETIVLIRDVTAEREHTERELQAGATRAVRDLASGVAHEIGNPLNAISLNLQLLGRTYPGDEIIGECRAQILRLSGILKDFLNALRPSRPNLMPGSVADPLKNCLATLKGQLEERRIAVTVNIPSALPAVALDPGQMEQVYFNLLKNALEAMKDGGAITIDIGSDDDNVKVAIRDTGTGIGAEQLAHLFEPYRTGKEHGTGLGLMISARVVRDHGGTIDVESTPGAGTVFTIRLPRIEKRIRALK